MTALPNISGVSEADRVIAQDWDAYSVQDHATWRALFERQSKLLVGRACDEYLAGLDRLGRRSAAHGGPRARPPRRPVAGGGARRALG